MEAQMMRMQLEMWPVGAQLKAVQSRTNVAVRNWVRGNQCDILCAEYLNDVEFKGNGLICLLEKCSRSDDIQVDAEEAAITDTDQHHC